MIIEAIERGSELVVVIEDIGLWVAKIKYALTQ
jgi:hypothetical protein